MITEIYISSDLGITDEKEFQNGLNIILERVSNDKNVSIKIICDGGKQLFPEFYIEFEELEKSIQKLKW